MRRINVTHYLNNFNLNPVLQVRCYIKALNTPDALMLHLCSKTAAEPICFHTNQWMRLHQPRSVAFWLIHSSNILEPSTELNKTSIYARWWSKSNSVYYYLFIIIIIHDHMWIILLQWGIVFTCLQEPHLTAHCGSSGAHSGHAMQMFRNVDACKWCKWGVSVIVKRTADELRDWCLWQVIDTTYGQSSGSMTTPAEWAQVTWKEVGHRPHEHWMQAPDCRFPVQRLRQ